MHKGISDKGLSRIAQSMFTPKRSAARKEVNAARPDEQTDEVHLAIGAVGDEALKDAVIKFSELVGGDPARLQAVFEMMEGAMTAEEAKVVKDFLIAKYIGAEERQARRQRATKIKNRIAKI